MTFKKVMFGVWLAWSFAMALGFMAECAAGEPEIWPLSCAGCGVVICQLYWRIWHEKAPEHYISIYMLPDGSEVRREEWK